MTTNDRSQQSFRFSDVLVTIECRDPRLEPALDRLMEDFANFPRDASVPVTREIRVVLQSEIGNSGRKGGFGRTRLTPRYRFFPRVCDHGGGTRSRVFRHANRTDVTISGDDTNHVYEIAYVSVLSVFGWELEKKGFVRLHALGVRIGDEAAVFHLPPKGGKSTLALECLKAGYEVLGDEVILVRGECAHAFPIRIAVASKVAEVFAREARVFQRKSFDQKFLVPLAQPRLEPVAIASILFQAKPGIASSASRASLLEAMRWIAWTCFGFGLPQMREFVLRLEELPWVPVVFFRRFAFAIRFAFRGRLLFSRGVALVGSNELRPRLEWVRSSFEGTSRVSGESRSRPPWDKASEERA